MNKDNQPGQIYKLIILTGLVLFVALVGYKIISSYIQENKEKAIIQERAKAQQVLPQTIGQKKAVLPEASGCELQSEIDSAKEWVHACYLLDLLSPQCKQLFDISGYYLTVVNIGGFPEGYVGTYEYLNNAKICSCRLPSDIANRLNNNSEYAMAQCGKTR